MECSFFISPQNFSQNERGRCSVQLNEKSMAIKHSNLEVFESADASAHPLCVTACIAANNGDWEEIKIRWLDRGGSVNARVQGDVIVGGRTVLQMPGHTLLTIACLTSNVCMGAPHASVCGV